MTQTTIVGIDYSLTSPCVCINDGEKIMFYYLTKKKKHLGKIADNIIGEEHLEYNTPIERFSNISNWAINKFNILGHNLKVFIEGYSYGSKGQALFQIAENCGILKYKLLERNIPYDIIVPSVVKKGATGKGNADKQKMYETFTRTQGVDLMKAFDQQTLNNPITDIVDSYYIMRAGYENSISNNI